MRKSLITSIIDSILTFTITAFFTIAVCGYFVRGAVNVIAAGITSAICVTALIGIFKRKKGKISLPEVKNVLNQFIFNDAAFAHKFIKSALEKKYTVTDNGDHLRINSTAIYIRLKYGKITESSLADIYSKARQNAKKILILSIEGADKNASALLYALPKPDVAVLNGEAVYRMLRWLDSLPDIEFTLKKPKLHFKDLLRGAITPDKARGYFVTALVLIGSSFFMNYTIYYIAAASVCLTLGIVSALNLGNRLKQDDIQPHSNE